MSQLYSYTPFIWPSFFTVVLLITLAVYAWRRRSMPGALPFLIACSFFAVWSAGSIMEVAAVDAAAKIFWFKFQGAWQLPSVTAVTCFILEYARPGHWLTRRNLALLSIPPLLGLGFLLTNDAHQLAFLGFDVYESVIPLYGPASWTFFLYSFALLVINFTAFAWLFVRSPQHRWPVVIMVTGQIVSRTIYLLHFINVVHFNLPLEVLGVALMSLCYATALFGFRLFDPVTLARQAVIDQMQEGVLVLDSQGQVTVLNPAAERIFGLPAKHAKGQPIRALLPAYPDGQLAGTEATEIELSLGAEQDVAGYPARFYTLEISLLKDWRGLAVGRLLLLHDMTEQKHAQAQIIEQQRVLAMFQERERLARELHDGIGQVLGYVKMQAQAARDRLAQGQSAVADSELEKLVVVAQDAHADTRDYLLGAKIAASGQLGLLPMLQRYLQRFSEHYALRTELIAPPEGIDGLFEPTVEAQLLRIIQEALTNVRKHARAQCAQVWIQLDGSRAQVIVQDDGEGFDPARLADGEGQKYGLGFLRERAEEMGGSVEIFSAPGQGTRMVVEVPVKKDADLWSWGDAEKTVNSKR